MAFKSEETRRLNLKRVLATQKRKRDEAKAAEWESVYQKTSKTWAQAMGTRVTDRRESAHG
jgi:hypothetical protein